MTVIRTTPYAVFRENTEIRYFNGRRYHVLTVAATVTVLPALRWITRTVFVTDTRMISHRNLTFHIPGFLPGTEMEQPS